MLFRDIAYQKCAKFFPVRENNSSVFDRSFKVFVKLLFIKNVQNILVEGKNNSVVDRSRKSFVNFLLIKSMLKILS